VTPLAQGGDGGDREERFQPGHSRCISTVVGKAEIDLDAAYQKLVKIETAIAAAKASTMLS